MRRRLLNVATYLSLLLCAAAVVMWGRSLYVCDALGHRVRRTDATDFGVHRVETRLEDRFSGAESAGGLLGIGAYRWEQPKRSLPIFAVEWEPVPDVDRVGWTTVATSARPESVPFAFAAASVRGALGFYVVDAANWPAGCGVRAVVVPYGAVVIVAGLLPAVRLTRRLRAARRSGDSLCNACGYDLRATPERCPECGRSQPAVTSAMSGAGIAGVAPGRVQT